MLVNARTYYDVLPSQGFRCGDIWVNLPTFGLLPKPTCTGIVITPDCDLSWDKSETISFLPIVPIATFLQITDALKIRTKLGSLYKTMGVATPPFLIRESPATRRDLQLERKRLSAILHEKNRTKNFAIANNRALHGIYAKANPKHQPLRELFEAMRHIYGADWDKLVRNIIRNSHASTIHFLPSDEQPSSFAAISAHSVSMFRYPLSLPVEYLRIACETNRTNWPHRLSNSKLPSTLRLSSHEWPYKALSLRANFLADLLSRYLALYSRLGSPDFSEATVNRFISEI